MLNEAEVRTQQRRAAAAHRAARHRHRPPGRPGFGSRRAGRPGRGRGHIPRPVNHCRDALPPWPMCGRGTRPPSRSGTRARRVAPSRGVDVSTNNSPSSPTSTDNGGPGGTGEKMIVLYALAAALGLGVLWLGTNLRVVKQFERGVVFRFGRVQTGVRAPGLTMLIPIADRLDKGQHADHHDAHARPRRHHPRQRDRPRGCRHLLQCRRSGARGRRRPGLHVRHRAGRPDIAAIDHRQKRPGRPAVQPRSTSTRAWN